MNQVAIPVILGSIVAIAGIFAFLPLDEVKTVHTDILSNTMEIRSVTQPGLDIDNDEVLTIDCNTDCEIHALIIDATGLTAGGFGFDALTVSGAAVTEVNAFGAIGDNVISDNEIKYFLLSLGAAEITVRTNDNVALTVNDGDTNLGANDTIDVTAIVSIAGQAADPLITLQ